MTSEPRSIPVATGYYSSLRSWLGLLVWLSQGCSGVGRVSRGHQLQLPSHRMLSRHVPLGLISKGERGEQDDLVLRFATHATSWQHGLGRGVAHEDCARFPSATHSHARHPRLSRQSQRAHMAHMSQQAHKKSISFVYRTRGWVTIFGCSTHCL